MQSLACDASAGFETATTMNKLLSIMRGVYVYRYTAPLAYYVDHLRKLEVCGLRVPTDPRFPSARPESQNVPVAAFVNIPEEQRMALVSSGSCFASPICVDSKSPPAYNAFGNHDRSYFAFVIASSDREHYRISRAGSRPGQEGRASLQMVQPPKAPQNVQFGDTRCC